MTWEWLALAGLALVALVLLAALAALRRRTAREIGVARAEAAELRKRLDRLEQARVSPGGDRRDYTITGVGGFETGASAPSSTSGGVPSSSSGGAVHLERVVFADHVLRESVIRLGSLVHGVRRALDAETRNRIRFEMRREVKRARKQRRAEQREAYREWRARERDGLTDEDLRETA